MRNSIIVITIIAAAFILLPDQAKASRLWSTGFELESHESDTTHLGGAGSFSNYADTTIKRSGNYSWRIETTDERRFYRKILFPGTTGNGKIYVRMYIRIDSNPGYPTGPIDFMAFQDSVGNNRGQVAVHTDGTLGLYLNSSQMGSSSTQLMLDTWYRVEMYLDHNTGNELEGKLNGTTFATGTGLTNSVDRIGYGVGINGGQEYTVSMNFDDMAVNVDTGSGQQDSWPGEGRIVNLYPNGAGDSNTASSGSWTDIDDGPVADDDTTRVTFASNGQLIDVNNDDAIAVGINSLDSISLVQVGLEVKSDTASVATFKLRAKSQASGTVQEGSVTTISDNTAYYRHTNIDPALYTLTSYTDPDTGSEWTPTLVNSMQVGVEAVDASPSIYVSQVWTIVEYRDEDWWDGSWTKRKKIFFNTVNTASTTDLTNFPLSVQFNSSRIDYGSTQNNGQDIRFVDADGVTQLPYEIEKWNETGTSTVWVKVPQIQKQSTVDYIWVYYGNPTASDAQNRTAVWSNGYVMVQHMNNTATGSGAFVDSTSYNNNGTGAGGSSLVATSSGKVDGAFEFDGNDDTVTVSNHASLSGMSQLTLSGWIYFDQLPSTKGQEGFLMMKRHTVSPFNSYYFEILNTGGGCPGPDVMYLSIKDQAGGGSYWCGNTSLATSTWYYLTATWDGSNVRMFLNGDSDYGPASFSASYVYISDDILRINWSGSNIDGMIDEPRIASTARSAEWVKFEYCNMNDGCLTYGDEVTNDWWNQSWARRRKVYFDTTTSATSSDLFNFPAVVSLTGNNINYAYTQNSGQDIRFVDTDNTTQLNYEIEKWNESATSTVWVKVPQIKHNSSSNYIWLYYDNPAAADNSTTTGVWDDHFVMVQHMNNTATGTDAFVDSTSYHNDGTGAGGGTSLVATSSGKVDGAFEVDGIDDHIEVADDNSLEGMSGLTLSGWVYFDQLPSVIGHEGLLMVKRHSADPWDSYYLDVVGSAGCSSPDVMLMTIKNQTGASDYKCANTSLATSTWYYIATTWDGVNVHFYLNGVNDDYDPTAFSGSSVFVSDGTLYINTDDSTGGRIDGMIDDVRISSTARSAEWIKFEFCNMSGTCTSLGGEETVPYQWWNTDWKQRQRIFFDTTTSATTTDLANFPAAIILNGNRINYSATQDSGQDIRFIDTDGVTELPYEIEKWDESATSTVWVKVPQIDKGSNADYIWLYYGNPAATDNSTTTGVWNSNYLFVHHLDESPADGVAGHFDSTATHATGTPQNFQDAGTGTTDAVGKLDGADYFDDDGTTEDYVLIPSLANMQLTATGTLEAWVKADLTTGRIATHSQNNDFWIGYASSKFSTIVYDGAGLRTVNSTSTASGGNWYYVVSTFGYVSGTRYVRLYVNGAYQGQTAMTGNINYEGGDYRTCLNAYGTCTGGFGQHTIDEVRLSRQQLSSDWVEFSYCNMNDSCTTYEGAQARSSGVQVQGGVIQVKGTMQIR